MKILHWNTHHGGKRTDAAGTLDVQGITDWIVKLKPDVVSLNELEILDGYGNSDQLEHHRAALEKAQGRTWYKTFCGMSGADKYAGTGVGILTSSMPVTVVRRDLGGQRPLLALSLTPDTINGPLVPTTIATLHADPDSAAKRNVELVNALLLLPVITLKRLIICGDFNAVPTAVEMAPWPTFYLDAWATAVKNKTATGLKVTHGSHVIDYVFLKNATPTTVDIPDTRDPTGSWYPSDHHPVLVTL